MADFRRKPPSAGAPSRAPRRAPSPEPRVRRHTARLPADVVNHVRMGHPFVYREAMPRTLNEQSGAVLELVDGDGQFVARGLYDPEGVVAIRVISLDPAQVPGPQLWHRRVEQAVALRSKLIDATQTTAYRIVNGEGDGIPGLTVDRYGDFLVVQLFTAALEPHLDAIYEALVAVVAPQGIYEQRRYKPQTGEGPRAPAQHVRGKIAPVEQIIRENGKQFVVDVTAPLSTGLFPDLRRGREAIARFAGGRRVLNLFSYTGAFSVYAAAAGATHVTSVDLATKAQARARRNFELNGLDLTKATFDSGDAFALLKQSADRGKKFELIVLDPPSFSQSKGRTFQALRDYAELVTAALSVAEPRSLVACAANTHKLSVEDHDRAIGEGAYRAGRMVRTIDRAGLPQDFPVPAGFADGHYLKFNLCYVE